MSILMYGGPIVGLLALTLFGLDALRTKSMPHLKWLPSIAGVWYPVAYIFLAVYLYTHNGLFPAQYLPVMAVVLAKQFFALCAFGAMLVADMPREMTAA
jgi:hypothetical protein